MGRKPGPDIAKLKKIKEILKENPNGIWIREIARKTGINRTSVSIYLTKYLSNDIEEVFPIKGKLMKIVRLRK